MHRHVVGLVALDQILGFFLRSADGVRLKLDGGSDLFLDRSPNTARFRVPLNMIADFEFVAHRHDVLCLFAHDSGFGLEVLAGNRPSRSSTLNGPGSAIN